MKFLTHQGQIFEVSNPRPRLCKTLCKNQQQPEQLWGGEREGLGLTFPSFSVGLVGGTSVSRALYL